MTTTFWWGKQGGKPCVGQSRDPLAQLLDQECRFLVLPPEVGVRRVGVLGHAQPKDRSLEPRVHDPESPGDALLVLAGQAQVVCLVRGELHGSDVDQVLPGLAAWPRAADPLPAPSALAAALARDPLPQDDIDLFPPAQDDPFDPVPIYRLSYPTAAH